MDSLREFFDCDVLCAPDILDAFGMIEIGTPTRREADWESWRKKYTRANVEGTATGRFAYQIDISGNALLIHAMADSQDRVKEWVKATLGSASYTAGNPYFHALIRRKPYLFVFSAEPGFVEHLKQRTRDQAPKRGPVVIDPNAPLPRP